MNLKYHRIGIDESGRGGMVQTFSGAKVFDSVGFSIIYTAIANFDMKNEIKKGDKVFFKANNVRGVGPMGRTVESMGSCEDVAEVFCYHLIKNMNEQLGQSAILIPTPYNFAEYENEMFRQIIKQQTLHLVDSSRLYGCVSPDVIAKNGIIIHGDELLKLLYNRADAMKSNNNNLFNYERALEMYVEKAKESQQQVLVHPISSRYNANLMFLDYFDANSDRHCKNINYQSIFLGNGTSIVVPLAVLDNGGALALQSRNCELLFKEQSEILDQKGRFESTKGIDDYNPFDGQFDFNIGKDCFLNSEMAESYDKLSYVEKLVMLISQNKILFNDFKNMYQTLDYKGAALSMYTQNKFPLNYLTDFERVVEAVLIFKKSQISKVMAAIMGENFSQEIFDQDMNYYLNKFEALVVDNALDLHIASDEEIKAFEEQVANLQAAIKKS